ncbi:hypothetical protein RHGRI_017809 [Rhododendron griersonianum]|uniref:Gnk2-homologous domain-containing protein n=1 Tax=Rhododendron griersonianum TaxID=479676 RepID=A0AAV6JZ72_9ERIC|nr:hypothetical protein RHGRI_017809 [Rhododendron griersonianum]
MSYLDSKTPLTGFGSGSLSLNQQNRTYGLALCRGDLNATDCKACVNLASTELQKLCQSTEAIIWYDYCELKYSDLDFLGKIDQQHWFYFVEPTNVSNPVYFNGKVLELLTNLTEKAYVSPKMYAAGTLGTLPGHWGLGIQRHFTGWFSAPEIFLVLIVRVVFPRLLTSFRNIYTENKLVGVVPCVLRYSLFSSVPK